MHRTVAQVDRRAKATVRFRTLRWHDPVRAANIVGVLDNDVPSRPILLLDDDPDVGIAAQLLLQRRVAPVTCLRRPAELFAALDRLHPSLLLLDLNFGLGRTDGAQGLHLLDEICARAHPPAIIVLTAYADIDLAVQALKRGAFDFIVKPWDNVRLVAACRDALRQAGHTTQEQTPQVTASAEPSRSLAAQERAAVMAAMTEAQGNLSAAARALGMRFRNA